MSLDERPGTNVQEGLPGTNVPPQPSKAHVGQGDGDHVQAQKEVSVSLCAQ